MKPAAAIAIPSLFKRTYRVILVVVLAILFFLGYNTYLVDRSLTNLKRTLEDVNSIQTLDDVKSLITALDYSLLAELSSGQLSPANIARIELAKSILSKAQDPSQLGDVKFALKQVIDQKEKERPAILSALDRITTAFAPAPETPAGQNMAVEVERLEEKAKKLLDKDQLQDTYYKLGNICSALSDFTKAREAYEKALSFSPASELADRIRFNLAWNERHKGNLDAAIKAFEQIAKTTARQELVNLSKYQIADIYREKGQYEKAIALYQQISSDEKENALAQLSELQTANTILYDLNDPLRAQEVFKKTEELFQGTEIADYIKTTAIPKIIAKYRNEGFILLDEAKRLSKADKYKEALKYFDKALEINPQDSESYAGKAVVYLWMNDTDRALEFAKKAVQLAPDNEAAITNLGYIYIQLNIIDEAIAEYKRFLSANPFSAHCYYNLGYAYAIQNRIEEASEAFRRALNINPRLAPAYNNYGWCLWKTGKYAEAISTIEHAVKLQPKYLDAIFNLGEVYRVMGRYEDARTEYQKVLKIDPANNKARDRLNLLDKLSRKKAVKVTPIEDK